MKCVYLAANLVEAQVFVDYLEGSGIPCEIFQQNAVGALGELPVIGPEIWVRRDTDQARARQLVQRLDRDMQQTSEQQALQCSRCGETSPGGFDVCWRCGTAF